MSGRQRRLRARNTFAPPLQGEFSRQCFSESPISGEYFGRLIATDERVICLLKLKFKFLSSDIKYMMLFGVTVQEID